MLKTPLLPFSLALASVATAQNLVPNPSFEDTARCNESDNLYLNIPPWFNPNTATPDVYDNNLMDPCGLAWDPADQDVQEQGFQYARTGTRFVGAVHWSNPTPPGIDSKEYIMVKLDDALQSGQAYQVVLHYSRPDGYLFAMDRIGVYFTPDSIHLDAGTAIDAEPQVELFSPDGAYLIESLDWVQLTDTFTAIGGERYMVIGNFQDTNEVNGILLPPFWPDWNYGYYYYDDISVSPVLDEGIADLVLPGLQAGDALSFTWLGDMPMERLQVVDAAGRVVVDQGIMLEAGFSMTVPVELAPGIYVVRWNEMGIWGAAKLIWLGRTP